MTGSDRSNRHHLRLIPTDAPTFPAVGPNPPSPHILAALIVSAAQAWAAEVLAGPLVPDPHSREGRARLALLDAVHDLEHHSACPTTGVPPSESAPDGPDAS